MGYKDLREFIAKLEEEGELQRIKVEVDWNVEIGSIMRKVFKTNGPAYRSIVLWGSLQRRGRRLCRSPQEREKLLIGVLFAEDFMKN